MMDMVEEELQQRVNNSVEHEPNNQFQEVASMVGSFNPALNNQTQDDDDGSFLQHENLLRTRASGFRGINLRPIRLRLEDSQFRANSPYLNDQSPYQDQN